MIERHDRVDTVCERGDGILLKHELGGHLKGWRFDHAVYSTMIENTYMRGSEEVIPAVRSSTRDARRSMHRFLVE